MGDGGGGEIGDGVSRKKSQDRPKFGGVVLAGWIDGLVLDDDVKREGERAMGRGGNLSARWGRSGCSGCPGCPGCSEWCWVVVGVLACWVLSEPLPSLGGPSQPAHRGWSRVAAHTLQACRELGAPKMVGGQHGSGLWYVP